MRNVTREQIEMARKIDLLTYLRLYEPDELVQKNPNEYRAKSHSSLVISNGKWYYNRGQIGGVSALDYLVKVRGVHFVEAVDILCGYSNTPTIPQETARPPPKKEFVLPKPVKYPAKMTAYMQKRGISPDIIRDCINSGILYESIPEKSAEIAELRAQLIERSEKNWDDYRHSPHNTTPDTLFNTSVEVINRRNAYVFMNDYQDFTAEQLKCLLQFANPVEVVGDYLDPMSDGSELPSILSSILEKQEYYKEHYALADASVAGDDRISDLRSQLYSSTIRIFSAMSSSL